MVGQRRRRFGRHQTGVWFAHVASRLGQRVFVSGQTLLIERVVFCVLRFREGI